MESLAEMRCVACRRDARRITEEEIEQLRVQIPEWNIVEQDGIRRLERTFKFKNFAGALAFTCKVGELAEAEGHHPALMTEWGRVKVSWWTHVIEGLHHNDFIMAAKTDRIAEESQLDSRQSL